MNASPEVCADLVPVCDSQTGTIESVPVAAADVDLPAASLPKPEAPFPFVMPFIVACLVGAAAMYGQMYVAVILEALVADPVFPPGMPRLSYGAPAMHLAQLVGGAAGVFGLACGLAKQRRRELSGFGLALLAGILAVILVIESWQGSEARYGYDPSNWPHFVAPFLLSVALTALSAACLAFFAITRTLRFVAALFGGEASDSSPAKTGEK